MEEGVLQRPCCSNFQVFVAIFLHKTAEIPAWAQFHNFQIEC